MLYKHLKNVYWTVHNCFHIFLVEHFIHLHYIHIYYFLCKTMSDMVVLDNIFDVVALLCLICNYLDANINGFSFLSKHTSVLTWEIASERKLKGPCVSWNDQCGLLNANMVRIDFRLRTNSPGSMHSTHVTLRFASKLLKSDTRNTQPHSYWAVLPRFWHLSVSLAGWREAAGKRLFMFAAVLTEWVCVYGVDVCVCVCVFLYSCLLIT